MGKFKVGHRVTAKAPKSLQEGVKKGIVFGKDGCAKPKVKTVIKAAMKPKIMEQTPVGMANATKSTPYIPPVKKNTKVKL